MDPDSLRIKRHGVPGDVDGQKLLVKKGQIIFGKRRAYQRKLGVADWDCICSAHAMVLEANPEKVLPEFLPFFMQSDVFMNRAVAISEGSLSPTIKWKVLAEQQFLLPSKSLQKEMVRLMSKSLEIFDYFDSAILAANKLKHYIASDLFGDGTQYKDVDSTKSKTDIVKLGNVAKFYNGRAYKLSEWESSGTPVIRLQNLTGTGNRFYYSNLELPDHQYCDKGDLLYMWSATFGPYIWESEKAIYHYHIWKIVCDDRVINKLFLYYLLEHQTEGWLSKSHGMGILHITKSTMESIQISLPSLGEQKRIINALQKSNGAINLKG